ncbi:thiaminase (transcriptional activator TenA) [Lactococcus chungangensis CAU 28 = DSM 22330]|uniref:Aminopyrimidine aminohydrolase n=2 Tax=Pseudolactococcus chungangensis CAU 28 = DSM 22330 TaxID=1122154 RepID=A0A1K2H9A1_9LACT|nr:thiaminase II [Lactococcus chungangensis]NCB81101.1 thiaminase II [Bacilli bacterium]SFZ73315.1 thiaminase (transcriptional activator TenA) [Lactococcus chungangensis CAU 28 = DSM 22330]
MIARKLKNSVASLWETTYQHPFVQELGQGRLPQEKFKFYLLQDYLYLLDYVRLMAYAAIHADDELSMRYFTTIQSDILDSELETHRNYMAAFDISAEAAEKVQPTLFNRAYAANMLTTAQSGQLTKIIATVLPCAWTYAEFSQRLVKAYNHELANNPYRVWLEKYASDDFAQSAQWLLAKLEALMQDKSEQDYQEIQAIFKSSLEFEYLFWEMSYEMQTGVFENYERQKGN